MKTNRSHARNVGLWATGGSLISAVLSSACCWLPLLLLAFGIAGGTLSATFAAWRPVLLPVTFLLLGVAFYFTYRRPKALATVVTGHGSASADGEACCPVSSKGVAFKKLNKGMLWVATVFVLAFAFFPNYVGNLLGGGNMSAPRQNLDTLVVEIEGMTCEACAATVEKALASVPGVAGVEVSYEERQAVVVAEPTVSEEALKRAVMDAGYTVKALHRKSTEDTMSGGEGSDEGE